MKRTPQRSWIGDYHSDDDDEYEYEDEDEGSCPDGLEVEGASYAPMHTGLLNSAGIPIIRHPVVMRIGFHPERNKYHAPTMEDTGYEEAAGKIFGWVYDV